MNFQVRTPQQILNADPDRRRREEPTEEQEQDGPFSFSSYFSRMMRTNPEVAGAFSTFEKYIPFVLILFVKQLFDHSTGKVDYDFV